jgi:hypothetical protein
MRSTADIDLFSPLSVAERNALGKFLRAKYERASEKWTRFGVEYDFPSDGHLDLGTAKSVFDKLYNAEWDRDTTTSHGRKICVPPLEDIIIMKAVAARKKDTDDLKDVLPKCWSVVDKGRVFRKLREAGEEKHFMNLLARLDLDQAV